MPVYAGDLVSSGKITQIAVGVNPGVDAFHVVVQEGTGPCNQQYIIFFRANSPSDGFFNRLYATALSALHTGATVRILGMSGDTCHDANYIQIDK